MYFAPAEKVVVATVIGDAGSEISITFKTEGEILITYAYFPEILMPDGSPLVLKFIFDTTFKESPVCRMF